MSSHSNGGHANSAVASKLSRKRTKTGCLTCRKRRIKCGEERPICNNCIKSKRPCEGYSQRVIFKPATLDWRSPQQSMMGSTVAYHSNMLSSSTSHHAPLTPMRVRVGHSDAALRQESIRQENMRHEGMRQDYLRQDQLRHEHLTQEHVNQEHIKQEQYSSGEAMAYNLGCAGKTSPPMYSHTMTSTPIPYPTITQSAHIPDSTASSYLSSTEIAPEYLTAIKTPEIHAQDLLFTSNPNFYHVAHDTRVHSATLNTFPPISGGLPHESPLQNHQSLPHVRPSIARAASADAKMGSEESNSIDRSLRRIPMSTSPYHIVNSMDQAQVDHGYAYHHYSYSNIHSQNAHYDPSNPELTPDKQSPLPLDPRLSPESN